MRSALRATARGSPARCLSASVAANGIIRPLDGKQITFAIAARAQRPAGMCGQRGVDHRVGMLPKAFALGIVDSTNTG